MTKLQNYRREQNMIDLTDDESKQGALDALRVLLASKIAPLRVEGEESELKMPKNSQQIEDDVDEDEENDDETNTQDDNSDDSDEDNSATDQGSDNGDDEDDNSKFGDDPIDRAKGDDETKEEKAARIRDELLDDAEEILADIKKDADDRKIRAAQKAKRDELSKLKKAAQEIKHKKTSF